MLATLRTTSVDMYVVMVGCAGLGILAYILSRRKKVNLSVLQAVVFTLFCLVTGLAEVMLMAFFETFTFGGTEIFGAVFFTPMIMPLLCKLLKLTTSQTLDLSAVSLAIDAAFTKIGCWFAGCCEGIVVYFGNTYFQWPAQIIGSVGGFIIVMWLLHIEANGNKQGGLYPLFMLSYGIMRFLFDSFEYMPDRWFGLRYSQCYALVAVAIAIVWLVIYKKDQSKDPQCLETEV